MLHGGPEEEEGRVVDREHGLGAIDGRLLLPANPPRSQGECARIAAAAPGDGGRLGGRGTNAAPPDVRLLDPECPGPVKRPLPPPSSRGIRYYCVVINSHGNSAGFYIGIVRG